MYSNLAVPSFNAYRRLGHWKPIGFLQHFAGAFSAPEWGAISFNSAGSVSKKCRTGRGGWVLQVDNTWLNLCLGVESFWVRAGWDRHIKQSSHLVGHLVSEARFFSYRGLV